MRDMKSMTSSHKVRKQDQKRIKCSPTAFEECGKPATMCAHVRWNTGNREGISFFYHCDEHFKRFYVEGTK